MGMSVSGVPRTSIAMFSARPCQRYCFRATSRAPEPERCAMSNPSIGRSPVQETSEVEVPVVGLGMRSVGLARDDCTRAGVPGDWVEVTDLGLGHVHPMNGEIAPMSGARSFFPDRGVSRCRISCEWAEPPGLPHGNRVTHKRAEQQPESRIPAQAGTRSIYRSPSYRPSRAAVALPTARDLS